MTAEHTEKQRILIVHNYYQIPGGEDTVVANEKAMLERQGHEVILYSRSNSELNHYSSYQKLLLPFASIFNPRTYREVKSIIKKNHIQMVHVHNTLNLISPSVYYAARGCKIPVVQTIHNFRLLCPGAMFYRDGHICEECLKKGLWCSVKYGCYRGSRFQTLACVLITKVHMLTGIYRKINYICLTEFNKEKLLHMKHIKPEQIFIKPNSVESGEPLISCSKRADQYVFVGRLEKLKGIDLLLEAWNLMGESAPKLIVCGTGPMEEWCKRYISEKGIDSIEMKGFVLNEQVRSIIAESRALILPTRLYEGFPMSILEAYSVGTPVICSDLGNSGRLVTEGVTGTKFKSGSDVDLVEAIKRLKRFSDIYTSTYDEFRMKYTWTQNYKILTEIYREIALLQRD